MRHLLVTNDFPPKVGGIQSLLWELWRRLPANEFTVLTTPYDADAVFDAGQPFRVVRSRQRWLLPTKGLVDQINQLADEIDADLVVLDPAFPLGLCGPRLNRPYVVMVHGAELAIPARMPVLRQSLRRLCLGSAGVIASGQYVYDAVVGLAEGRCDVINIPPGVDPVRFRPLASDERLAARQKFGFGDDELVIVGVSRLVPRKGFDRLIRACAQLRKEFPNARVVIGGKGREAKSLASLARQLRAPATFLGKVSDVDLPELYGCADVFALPAHDRWFGLEREGFGIVFIEAASAGLPTVVGLSGGSGETVEHGRTGYLVDGGVTVAGVASALKKLLSDAECRQRFGEAGRLMAVERFSYDRLSEQLGNYLNSRRPAG